MDYSAESKPDIIKRRLELALNARPVKLRKKEIAERCNVSEAAVGKWFRTGKIHRDNLPGLAATLNRSIDWILGIVPEFAIHESATDYRDLFQQLRFIPILDKTAALDPVKEIENTNYDIRKNHVAINVAQHTNLGTYTFAMRLDDDTMAPDMRSGDLVVIDPNREHQPGNIVCAQAQPFDFAIIRKYRATGYSDTHEIADLIPSNADYPTIPINEAHPGKIIGTVIEHRRVLVTNP